MTDTGLEKMKHKNGTFLGIEVATFRNAVESSFSGGNPTPVIIELIKD
jgi:hypothetical protein